MSELATKTPWREVQLTVHYSDRGLPKSQQHVLSRDALEASEKQALLETALAAEEQGAEQIAAEYRERAEKFSIPDDEFEARVLAVAGKLASSPMRLEGSATNVVRILPPWAVKEVELEVLNARPILTLS